MRVLDHYLEILARKPGALPGATALAQARAAGVFTAAHEAFWAAARASHGDSGGTRALIEVLLLHRHLTDSQVLAGIRAAPAVGALSADLVAIEARKHPASGQDPARSATVLSLPERPAQPRPTRTLPADIRPLPSVAAYDQLLLGDSPEQEVGS
jgi:hypothetical protein